MRMFFFFSFVAFHPFPTVRLGRPIHCSWAGIGFERSIVRGCSMSSNSVMRSNYLGVLPLSSPSLSSPVPSPLHVASHRDAVPM